VTMYTSDFRPIGQRLYEDLVEDGSTSLFVRLVSRDGDYDWYLEQMEEHATDACLDIKVVQDLRDTMERHAECVYSPLDIEWWVLAKHEQWERQRESKRSDERCMTYLREVIFSETKRGEKTPMDITRLIFSFLYA